MTNDELEAIITYFDTDASKADRKLRDDLNYVIDNLVQICEYAQKANIPSLHLEQLISEYDEMLADCTSSIKRKALEYVRRKNVLSRISDELSEELFGSDDDDDSSEKECNKDCCDCRTCRYYEEGPIQWGFADGEQVFGEGMCYEDDRRIVKKATGHEPCPVWKSLDDTSPDIDWP